MKAELRFALLFFACFAVLASEPPPPVGPGVIVLFKKGTPLVARDKAHLAFHSQLLYRSQRLPHDWVMSPLSDKSYEKEAALCKQYKKLTTVGGCIPNYLPRGYRGHSQEDEVQPNRPVNSEGASACRPPTLFDFQGLPPMQEGTLSPLWAQEAIGADLVRADVEAEKISQRALLAVYDMGFAPKDIQRASSELRKEIASLPERMENQEKESSRIFFGPPKTRKETEKYSRWDALKDDGDIRHGTLVAHLANSHPQFGSGVMAELNQIGLASVGELAKSVDASLAHRPPPAVVNLSVGYEFDDAEQVVSPVLKQLMDGGPLLVVAAGNSYPLPINKVDRDFGGILVGSLSPHGTASSFSQEGPEVTISAPGDSWTLSAGPGGETLRFGGTSAASPLTAGCLTNAAAFLPRMTNEEAKNLLQFSSLPTRDAKAKPPLNGAGALNCYGVFRVAKRLAAGWPGNRTKLADADTYNFSKEAQQLLDQAKQLLGGGCDQQKEGFNKLRQAVFLDPANIPSQRLLASWYEKQGLRGNGSYFRGLSATDEELAKTFRSEIASNYDERQMNGLQSSTRLLGKKAIPTLENALSHPEESAQAQAIQSLLSLGAGDVLEKHVTSLPPDLQKYFVRLANPNDPHFLAAAEKLYRTTKEPFESFNDGTGRRTLRECIIEKLKENDGDHEKLWKTIATDGDPHLLSRLVFAEHQKPKFKRLLEFLRQNGALEKAAPDAIGVALESKDFSADETLALLGTVRDEANSKLISPLYRGASKDPQKTFLLAKAIASRSPATAHEIVGVFSQLGSEGQKYLEDRFAQGTPEERVAIIALGASQSVQPWHLKLLREAADSQDPVLLEEVGRVAARNGEHEIVTKLLRHPSPLIRQAVAENLSIRSDNSKPIALKVLADPEPEVRLAFSKSLFSNAEHLDAAALEAIFKDSNVDVRRAFSRHLDSASPLALELGAQDPDPQVRANLINSELVREHPEALAKALANKPELRQATWKMLSQNDRAVGFIKKNWKSLPSSEQRVLLAGINDDTHPWAKYQFISQGVSSPDPEVKRLAAAAYLGVFRNGSRAYFVPSDEEDTVAELKVLGATPDELSKLRAEWARERDREKALRN